MNLRTLFHERKRRHDIFLLKQVQYILNDHFLIALVFIIGALAYQYAKWLKAVDHIESYWGIMYAIALALTIYLGEARTYVSGADIQYRLVQEGAFSAYFKAAFIHSLRFPFLMGGMILFVSYPYLLRVHYFNGRSWLGLLASYLLFRLVDMATQFYRFHWFARGETSWLRLLLFFLATGSFYLFLRLLFFYGFILSLLTAFGVLAFLYQRTKGLARFNYQTLLSQEERRFQRERRRLGLFVDLPQGRGVAKRRRYLDGILVHARDQLSPLTFLYARGFWRSPELFVLWLRLTLIGLLLVFILPAHWSTILIAILVQYLSHMQLLPLYRHYQDHVLLKTWPIDFKQQEKAFINTLSVPLLVQYGLIMLAFLHFGNALLAGSAITSGLLFIIVFTKLYLPWKVRKTKQVR